MSLTSSTGAPAVREREPAGEVKLSRRRRMMHLVRRAHLYLGLFLLPWVLLYSVTAYLFNHPSAFADQPTTHFSPATVAGTPLESIPTPLDTATAVVAELNRRGHAVELVHPETAAFKREFAFATVKANGQTVSILVDATTGGGTIRSKVDEPPRPAPPPAPFTTAGRSDGQPSRGRVEGSPAPRTPDDSIRTDRPLHERMVAALPTVLTRNGYPTGAVVVTSTPEVMFDLRTAGQDWRATYSPMTGAVTGVPSETVLAPDLTARRFLLRLHTVHGYPGETNIRWWWALIVDVLAGVMVFWAASGIFMWWQLKATRRLGVVALVVSVAVAAWMTFSMYTLLTRPV